jgi:hypothetical protein
MPHYEYVGRREIKIDEYIFNRPKTLELLQRPARRRHVVWRLRRGRSCASMRPRHSNIPVQHPHLSAVSKDGRRSHSATAPALLYLPPSLAVASAVQPEESGAGAVQLAEPRGPVSRLQGKRIQGLSYEKWNNQIWKYDLSFSNRSAAKAVTGRSVNGWYFWYAKDPNGDWVKLKEVAK